MSSSESSHHRKNDPKGKGKGKAVKEEPLENTSEYDLDILMRQSEVKSILVEFAQPKRRGWAVNADRRRRGKGKNHVTFRFIIARSFPYVTGEKRKICGSIRADAEPDNINVSWVCSSITIKPMPIADVVSHNATGCFEFNCPQRKTVREFLNIATYSGLLPFEYVIVARTVEDDPESRPRTRTNDRERARSPAEIQAHSNGCRDFAAQWWVHLYQANFVEWWEKSHLITFDLLPVPSGFDSIIGYRYSRGVNRPHQSPIAYAKFPPLYRHVEELMIGQDLMRLPYARAPLVVENVSRSSVRRAPRKPYEDYQDPYDDQWPGPQELAYRPAP